MPWQNNSGGGNSPWGQGPRPTGGGGGGGGPQPPNIDDILKKGQDRFKNMMPKGLGGGKGIGLIVVALLALWLATGLYRVLPGEQGVELVFGDWNGKLVAEGLHYNWPAPIGNVYTPKVAEVRKLEVGFQTVDRGRSTVERSIGAESLMLTGDENIIDIDFEVFWRIKDAAAYLFNIQAPETTVKGVAESAMREVIGQTPLQEALTRGRLKIEQETLALLQSVLDDYQSGVEITEVKLKKSDTPPEVIDDFRDVQAAGADREAAINEAQAYRNQVIPEARGQAAKIVEEAQGYKQEVVNRSQGEASRFEAVYEEYRQAEDVTRKRIYLETMEEILREVDKIIIDGEAGSGVVPYLPLPEVQKRTGGNQ